MGPTRLPAACSTPRSLAGAAALGGALDDARPRRGCAEPLRPPPVFHRYRTIVALSAIALGAPLPYGRWMEKQSMARQHFSAHWAPTRQTGGRGDQPDKLWGGVLGPQGRERGRRGQRRRPARRATVAAVGGPAALLPGSPPNPPALRSPSLLPSFPSSSRLPHHLSRPKSPRSAHTGHQPDRLKGGGGARLLAGSAPATAGGDGEVRLRPRPRSVRSIATLPLASVVCRRRTEGGGGEARLR